MQLTPDQQRLWKIFHPKAAEEESTIIKHNIRFVHYTSAATVLKVLSTKRIWMRKTSCMNDYRERFFMDWIVSLELMITVTLAKHSKQR